MKKAKEIIPVIGLALIPAVTWAAWGKQTPPTGTAVPTDFETMLNNAINWILGIIGLISVLIIIYGGVLYLTSVGSADRVKQAKDTLKYGIMGLVIAGIAYAVVNVIITTILK